MLPPSIPTLAQNAASTLDALPHLAGMLLVISTLAALWGGCVLMAKLVKFLTPAPPAAPAPAPVPATAAPAPPAEPTRVSPEIVAVIAAAVASVTGRNHRIISIKSQSSQWEKAGRHSVLTSHRIR